MNYEIDQKTLQATLEYLATRPYQEVAMLISTLQKAKPIREEKETEEESKK